MTDTVPMRDIVKRLREASSNAMGGNLDNMYEAADEINRLRNSHAVAKHHAEGLQRKIDELMADIARLRSRAAKFEAIAGYSRSLIEEKWLLIATAPRDGTEILLWDGQSRIPGRWSSLEPAEYPWLLSFSAGAWRHDVPTHWMPLPDPPETPK